MLVELIDRGMNVARLNFSHGSHEVRPLPPCRFRRGIGPLTRGTRAGPCQHSGQPQRRPRGAPRQPRAFPARGRVHTYARRRLSATAGRGVTRRPPTAQVAILLDTKGPEIRTGFLKDHQPVKLVKGSEVVISTDYEVRGRLWQRASAVAARALTSASRLIPARRWATRP